MLFTYKHKIVLAELIAYIGFGQTVGVSPFGHAVKLGFSVFSVLCYSFRLSFRTNVFVSVFFFFEIIMKKYCCGGLALNT